MFVYIFAIAQSQEEQIRPDLIGLKKQGQLVTVRLVPGEPLRIFVVGREEAKINLSDLKVTVKRLKPYPGKTLAVDRYQNYFAVAEPIDRNQPTDLEVTTNLKGKSEVLNFTIKSQLH